MKQILHIGYPKCASTTLQRYIFPKIAKSKSMKLLLKDDIINMYRDNNLINKIENLPTLISFEGLIGGKLNDFDLKASFQKNIINFPKNMEVLIIIRRPSEIINSIFLQYHHEGYEYNENTFIQNFKDQYSKEINISHLKYKDVIKLYRSYFKSVTVIKYEEISKFDKFSKIFDLSNEEILHLKEIYKLNILNRGYSKQSMLLKKTLSNIFKNFSNSIFYDYIKKLKLSWRLRNLNQNYLDKILFKNKYYFEFSEKFPELREYDTEYDNIFEI